MRCFSPKTAVRIKELLYVCTRGDLLAPRHETCGLELSRHWKSTQVLYLLPKPKHKQRKSKYHAHLAGRGPQTSPYPFAPRVLTTSGKLSEIFSFAAMKPCGGKTRINGDSVLNDPPPPTKSLKPRKVDRQTPTTAIKSRDGCVLIASARFDNGREPRRSRGGGLSNVRHSE